MKSIPSYVVTLTVYEDEEKVISVQRHQCDTFHLLEAYHTNVFAWTKKVLFSVADYKYKQKRT